MGTKRDVEIGILLDEAQRAHRCLAAHDRELKAALDRRTPNQLVCPRSHLYARKGYWDGLGRRQREEHLLRAEATLRPGLVLCHASAALLHGLPVSFRRLASVHVLSGERWPSTRSAGRVTRHRRTEATRPMVERLDGILVTSLEDTIVDCLLELGFREGLAIADAGLARLGIDAAELDALISERGRHRPGVRHALETARHADAHSESGGESMARAIMIEHGFMLPELQVLIENPDNPGHPWRCDFFWELPDGTIVVGELDGGEKYVNPAMTHGRDVLQVMRDERLRESGMTLAVDRVMRFTFSDVANEARLVALLERFGIPHVA